MNKTFKIEETKNGYILHILKEGGIGQAIPLTVEEFENLYAALFLPHYQKEDRKMKEMQML